ncbi:MAG: hypothetical protein PHY85_01680 [Bacteroidales bacterium]|nr:hypothetical protein [Bacteroidales bacterium]
MKKSILTSIITIIILVSISSISACKCKKTKNNTAEANTSFVDATVIKRADLIGSCAWVIELSDGTRLEPRGLQSEFKIDGKKIKIEYEELEGLKSKCMTGKIVKILNVKPQ